MRYSFTSLLLVGLLYSISFSQEKTSIAVLNLDAHGISEFEVATLTDRLRNELVNTQKYRVLEREKMDEILEEMGLQQSGCTSNECLVEVGKLINVQQMVGGSIGKVGKTFTVSLRIIDVEKGEIVKTETEDYKGEIDYLLTDIIPTLAGNLASEVKLNIKKTPKYIPNRSSKNNNEHITKKQTQTKSEGKLSVTDVKNILKENDLFCNHYAWNSSYSNPNGQGIKNEYEISSNGKLIYDHTSGIIWQRSGSDKRIRYPKSEMYVDSLNKINFSGYNKWRLPTLKEAMTLLEYEAYSSIPLTARYIDSIFPKKKYRILTSNNLHNIFYNSSSKSKSWYIDFSTGTCRKESTSEYIRVACLAKDFFKQNSMFKNISSFRKFRKTANLNLPLDSVATMLKANDFFCTKKGAITGINNLEGKGFPNKFIKRQGEKVIQDEASGLIWQQSVSSSQLEFYEANLYIEQLNKDNFDGYSDWRLPTLEEVFTLVENKNQYENVYTTSTLYKTFIDYVFEIKRENIWTSDKLNSNSIYTVSFWLGTFGTNNLDSRDVAFVRAVRSAK